jgi:hypothetical protein
MAIISSHTPGQQLASLIEQIIEESRDSFLMLPEAIERIERECPNLVVEQNVLAQWLHDAAGAAGIPIGLEWSD